MIKSWGNINIASFFPSLNMQYCIKVLFSIIKVTSQRTYLRRRAKNIDLDI